MNRKEYISLTLLSLFSFLFILIFDNTTPLAKGGNYIDLDIYYEIGKVMCNGKILYQDVFDTKGPFMFIIGAISYKLFKNYTAFFILDLISILLFTFSSFKIFRLYFEEKKSILLTILNILFTYSFATFFGSPEGMLMGIILYFIYWILNKGFLKDNRFNFFIFGLYSGFIFLTKINYLLGFGLIAICYLISSIKNKNYKKLIQELLFFFIGFFIMFIPIIIYEIIINKPFFIIPTYLLGAIGYSKDSISIPIFIFMMFFLFVLRFMFFILKEILLEKIFEKDFSKVKDFSLIFVFMIGIILSILMTRRVYFYYFYLLYPFYIFTLLFLIRKNKLFAKIINLILILFILIITKNSFENKDFLRQFNEGSFCQKQIYEDYKDEITKDSSFIGLFNINTLNSKYFDFQPNSKYFVTLNNSIEKDDKYVDYIYNGLINKEIDYISVLFVNENLAISESMMTNLEKFNEKILNPFNENYKLDNIYEINYLQSDIWNRNNKYQIGIFVPKD